MTKNWLLIGGPGHGTTMWLKAGQVLIYSGRPKPMVYRDGDLVYRHILHFEYVGQHFRFKGRLYQLGLHQASHDEIKQIDTLIVSTQLQPIPDNPFYDH